jgi:hypothetical protein
MISGFVAKADVKRVRVNIVVRITRSNHRYQDACMRHLLIYLFDVPLRTTYYYYLHSLLCQINNKKHNVTKAQCH